MLKQLLLKTRSYRRFNQSERIPYANLSQWVDNVRYCPSGRNLQPLKYKIIETPEDCASVFPALAWAGYLKDWKGPEEGERPAAYIIQLLDTSLTENCMCDDGLHLQTLMLSASEEGYGGCIIKAFNNIELRKVLNLPQHLKINYVLALGKPVEEVVIEPLPDGGDIRYWRSQDGVHHVPKRPLQDLLV